jgi:hypothetical protein
MQSKVKCGNQYAGDDVDATWPFVDKREKDCSGGKAELEPGETDQFNFDFFIDPAIETVSVYAYLENVTKSKHGRWRWSKPRKLGWSVTTLHDISRAGKTSRAPEPGKEDK